MSADKIERFREVLTMRISPAQFDALIAAVREDEREKCEAEMAELREELWRAERSNAP